MYRLLIVDDEPDIADGLYIFFRNVEHLELDVYKAYSGSEAIEVLNHTKIDIVLTDICMPGLTGLNMLEKIHASWPQCRVIFLTGHEEFDYVYTAIKYEGVSYLLKTEGYDQIAKAVEKAIDQIEASMKTGKLVEMAQKYMTTVIPFMQKEYLTDLLNDDSVPGELRSRQFKELEIPLNPYLPVLMLLGRFDSIPAGISSVERMRILCSIKLIAEQSFPAVLTAVHVDCERTILLWLIQPKEFIENDNMESADFQWQQLVSLVKGNVDTIQSACRNSLNISISFIIDNEGTAWENLSGKYDSLKLLLYSRMGMGEDMLMVNGSIAGSTDMKSGVPPFKKMKLLEIYLESGQKEEFFQLLYEARKCFNAVEGKHYNPALEVFYSISLMFLSYINRWNLTDKIAFKIGLNKLTHVDEHMSWDDAFAYFRELALVIFEIRDNEEKHGKMTSIDYIKQYINNHLSEDLSLARLAEKVYFNPSYFSRMFKQSTGINILSYINDIRIGKAKELLQGSDMKIHEIAAAVGYDSPSYFTQFFKRSVKISPQEYRDSVTTSKGI